jgi:hypothetical protein
MTFNNQQDIQILCRTGYNQPIMLVIPISLHLMTNLVHDLSNVFPFISEIGAHGNSTYQVGHEVIIIGDSIR